MVKPLRNNNKQIKKRRFEEPDAYVILFVLVLLAAIATYIVPAGSFEREIVDGVEQILPGTYEKIDSNPVGFLEIFLALQTGMVESGSIIFLVLFAGGMFQVIEETGTIRAGILKAVNKAKGREFLLIAIVSTLFAIGGAVGVIANSIIPFVTIGIMIARALRLDAIFAVALTFGATFAGFSVAFMNPTTLILAQSIAEVPLLSGMAFRLIFFVIIVMITVLYIWNYAKKVMADPNKSLVGILESNENESITLVPFTNKHKIILTFVTLSLAFFIFATLKYQWSINHMSALFVFIGLISGIIGGMNYNKLSSTFLKGCTNLVYGALIIGLARAVLIIMEDANILETFVHLLSIPLMELTPVLGAIGMFVANIILNFFINSGSGQAMIAMPILTPLADMVGLTRQVAVQTYQLGDGFSNLVFPTSGTLMACLAVAGVSWTKWLRWILPLFIIWSFAGIIMLVIAVLINWGPI